MRKPSRTTCPDCDGPLRAIRLIDHADRHDQFQQEYAAGDAKRGFWLGFPIEGTVAALVCEDCGRILLYAEPGRRDNET
jgi:hypothetical protein